MVEFGLKLEDNKVSEWAQYYLNYEELKSMLKKAKTATKKSEEHGKKRPQDAERIVEAHRSGITDAVTPASPMGSKVSLTDYEVSEKTRLLAISEGSDFSSMGLGSTQPLTKTNNLFSSQSFSDFFDSRFERSLRTYLRDADVASNDFAEAIVVEQTKCVNFYNGKLSELEKQLGLLIETVANSVIFRRSMQPGEEEDSTGSVRLDGGHHRRVSSGLFGVGGSSHHRRTSSGLLGGGGGGHHRRNSSELTARQRVDLLIQSFQKKINDNSSKPSKSRASLQVKQKAAHTKLSNEDSDGEEDEDFLNDEKVMAEADSIKRALIDSYRTAKLLQNYVIMNYTGFVKIVKKHDKTIPAQKGRFKDLLKAENLFNEGKEIETLSSQYEKYYANWFCDGDVRAAYAQMLPKRGDGLEMDWSQLRLGYRMGMCAVLALWVCWDSVWGLVANGNSTIGGRSAFPIFRACGGILLLQWFWGCSVFIWTRYRINYIYLFDFNPKIVDTPLGIFEDAVDNTLVFNLLMLLYYKSGTRSIPQVLPDGAYPFMLVLYTVWNLVFPLRSRLPMWEAIFKVVTAPMHAPSFFHGYIGDIFTSMVKVFQDIAWTACWVFSGSFMRSEDLKNRAEFPWPTADWYKHVLIPLLCLFPLVVRFNQCLRRYIDTGDRFPHLANAGKYALSQTVTLFGAFHPLYLEYGPQMREEKINLFQIFWLLVFVSSSLYSFTWDVFMDWGLGRKEYGFLGPSLMYPRRYCYYVVMAIDLVLRFMWVLTLVPPSSGAKFEVPSYLSAVTMMLELFRRTAWGFFRLENEHRSNASGFRRVGFVPLHFNTGHQHDYKEKKKKSQQSGVYVLREVILIALGVGGVCVWSVVSAQTANRVLVESRSLEEL